MSEAAKIQNQWRGHIWLSRVLRLLIFLIPICLSVTVSLLAAHFAGPVRLGINRWVWWASVAVLATVVLLVADHLARRLLPLTALLKMTLIFPDSAPSRFGLAMRTGTTKQLERLVQQSKSSGSMDIELNRAAMMLELVAALGVHDRLTRGHCERVRAYTDLVIKEMHLPESDANLLRWAALLHDVGKLRVPREILSSDQRPTDSQWKVLTTHPAEGMALTESLDDWLGEWRRTIGEHHERWDGEGYPNGLVREHIHLGARIVAVTDAFDVMTSARSYKKPIPTALAREEIARCSASQFDPAVVRAFLNIGLRRLRFALGPLAWISNIPFFGQAPIISAASNAIGGVATASVLAVATATAASPVTVPPPRPIPIVQTHVVADPLSAPDVDVSGNRDEPMIVTLHGLAETRVTLALKTSPQHGEALVSRQPNLPTNGQWTGELVITPQSGFTGRDQLGYTVCDSAHACQAGTVRINLVGPSPSQDTVATTTTQTAVTTIDTSGSTPTSLPPTTDVAINPPAAPAAGTTTTPARVTTTTTTASPTTTTDVPTTTSTTDVPTTTSTTDVPTTTVPPTTTTLVASAPIAADDYATGTEDQTQVTPLADLLGNDTDANGDQLTILSVHDALNGTVQMTSTHAVFVPDADFFGAATFVYTVCDPGNLCADATVTLTFTAVPDAPRPVNDDYVVARGSVLNLPTPGVIANDLEPDGEPLTVNSGLSLTTAGAIDMHADGSFTYTPAPLFTGQDTASYTVCDPTGRCATATISITVSPGPSSTQTLHLTGNGGPAYALSTSAPPVANPEPDTPGDGDNSPGLTLRKDSQPGATWTYQFGALTHLAGPVSVDLFSAVKNFNTGEQATLAAELFQCDGAWTNCVSLLQRQWTDKPWSVGGSPSWTERRLTIGTIDRFVAAGDHLILVLTASQRDIWIALSGDRPSALQLTI